MEAKEISKDGEGNHDYHGLVQIEKNAKKVLATYISYGMATMDIHDLE